MKRVKYYFCKCHILNVFLPKIYPFYLFCVVPFFLFATPYEAFQMFTKKVFQVERHTEVFLPINLCDTIHEQDFRV